MDHVQNVSGRDMYVFSSGATRWGGLKREALQEAEHEEFERIVHWKRHQWTNAATLVFAISSLFLLILVVSFIYNLMGLRHVGFAGLQQVAPSPWFLALMAGNILVMQFAQTFRLKHVRLAKSEIKDAQKNIRDIRFELRRLSMADSD